MRRIYTLVVMVVLLALGILLYGQSVHAPVVTENDAVTTYELQKSATHLI